MSPLEECARRLNHPEETERIYAAEDMGYLNTADAVSLLLQQLAEESSRTVRDSIFQALARIDADSAIAGAIGLLTNDDPQIRNGAVDVLRRKNVQAVPFLDQLMRDGNKNTRKLVLDVLLGIRADAASEIYTAALTDKDLNIVITAVENLGKMRAVEFRHQIENLLQADTNPMLMAVCMEALAGAGDNLSLVAVRRCFLELATAPDFLLVPCLKAFAALGLEKEYWETAHLLSVRAPHCQPAILEALIAIYPRCKVPDPGSSLLTVITAIIETGGSPQCRYRAVRLMGLWPSSKDVNALIITCLSNPERLVRLAAVESLRLARTNGCEAALAQCAQMETDEEILEALTC